MKFFLDTASIDKINYWKKFDLVQGVTTNPTLLSKEGNDSVKVIKEICKIVNGDISAQVTEREPLNMIEQAKFLKSIDKKIVIKLPCTLNGITAAKVLAKKKYSFTALLISHCGRVGRKEMRRRSSRERTQRQFFQPTFTTKDNKTGEDKKNEELFLPTSDKAINKDKKKSRLKVRSIYDYEDDDDDDDDDGDGDGDDNEEEDEEDDLVGKIKMRKTKKDKGVKNDEYYVDVDSLKVSPDRKEYLRKVFKRDCRFPEPRTVRRITSKYL